MKAKRSLSLSTTSRRGSLDENKRAILRLKIMIIEKNKMPIIKDVNTDTVVANLAPFALPAPSSFSTLTLHHKSKPQFPN